MYSCGSVRIDSAFTYGGLVMIRSYFLNGTFSYRSDSIGFTRPSSLYSRIFVSATASASFEMSIASTTALANVSAIMIARQPLPVHSSSTFSTPSGSTSHGLNCCGISSAMNERGTSTRSST